MRKVAFFIPSIERGGVERTMTRVANGFVDRGYEVDLVFRIAEPMALEGISSKARRVKLDSSWYIPRFVPPRIRVSMRAFPGLINYLRSERPDVLLSFQSSVLAVWAKGLSGVSARLIVREASVPSEAATRDRRLSARLTLPLKRWTYPKADAIVATSDGAGADLARILNIPTERINVIHNPTFEDSVLELAKEPLQDNWLQSEDTPIILGVGRLSYEKNFSMLLRTFALVRQSMPCKLLILGEGEERDNLLALSESLGVSESVFMPGFVKNPYPYMTRASLFVSPSLYEGFPNAIIESLALGLPVVATRCPGGTADILMGGKAGPLVPVNDEQAMAEAILAMLRDRELASNYLAEGQRGLDRFRPETSISKYIELVESDVPVPEIERAEAFR